MSEVRDNAAERRFELEVEGELAVLTYRRQDGALYLLHTEVPEALRGDGHASRLVRHALDTARDEEVRVVPLCPFVGAFLEKNPEYASLAEG
jgi:uncharacterized protein